MFVQINPKIKKYGNHRVKEVYGEFTVATSKQIQLLHYDCVGIKNWMSKWDMRVETSGKANNMRGNRVKQFKQYIQAKDKGLEAQSALFRRMHCVPVYERIVLFLLGMLKIIKLNQDLFKSPV